MQIRVRTPNYVVRDWVFVLPKFFRYNSEGLSFTIQYANIQQAKRIENNLKHKQKYYYLNFG